MKSKNYTIIGSGLGSLTAGALLAKQGHTVKVYEKFSQIGGYATLFKRKGFTFDVSLHQIGGVHKGGLHKILKAADVYKRLTFIQHKFLTEMEFPDGKYIAIPNGDALAFKEQLLEQFPEDKSVIKKWFRVMKRYGVQVGISELRHRSVFHQAIIDLFAPILYPQILWGSLTNTTLKDTINSSNEELKDILTHFSVYYGLPADEINQMVPMLANYGFYFHGGYYIKGGGHELAKQLANVIRENGGEIHTNSYITSISITDEQANSITVNDKRKISVDNLIMSGSPHQLYGSLLKEYKPAKEELSKLNNNKVSITASVLYVALDCPIGELNKKLESAYEYTFESSLNEKQFYDLFLNNRDFEGDYSQWPLALSIHSNIDTSSLPKSGGCCFDIFVADNYDRWDALSEKQYRAQKEIEIEKLLVHLETQIPKIREHLVVAELGTPKTMERYTGNPKGAFYGFAQDLPQTMFRRTAPRSAIKNIEFASAWTRPGGGYEGSMQSGFRLANKSKPLGFVLIGVIIAGFEILRHLI